MLAFFCVATVDKKQPSPICILLLGLWLLAVSHHSYNCQDIFITVTWLLVTEENVKYAWMLSLDFSNLMAVGTKTTIFQPHIFDHVCASCSFASRSWLFQKLMFPLCSLSWPTSSLSSSTLCVPWASTVSQTASQSNVSRLTSLWCRSTHFPLCYKTHWDG